MADAHPLVAFVLTKLVDQFSSAVPVMLWVAGATVLSAACAIPMRRAAEIERVPALDRNG